jgi:hypothetical protein
MFTKRQPGWRGGYWALWLAGNCWRDINVAAQHLMVSDITYETHGQFALGLPDADPMR